MSVAGTLAGASIIGKLPAKPLVTPSAIVNMNEGASPPMIGWARGAQHSSSNGTSAMRTLDSRIS